MTRTRFPSAFLPAGIQIEPRKLEFTYDHGQQRYWVDGDAFATRFAEAMSMFFPDGERFFVDSVQHYKSRITDPELSRQIAGFIRQEGLHSSEHRRYNQSAVGGSASRHQRIARVLLYGLAKRVRPAIDCLAITVALEHFTAILAHEALSNPYYREHMAPDHAKMWMWHAVEETEHKAVAFDVFRAVGGGYFRRVRAMLVASVFFVAASLFLVTRLLKEDGQLWKARNLRSFWRYGFGEPGLFRRVFVPWLSFFRPSFHPWQHDNSQLVERWKAEATPPDALAAT